MGFFSLPVLTATVAGLAGAVGQVLVLRELLVLFYGNELSTGLVFSCWLLWTALGSAISGRFGSRFSACPALLPVSLILLALLLPLTLLWIRASRLIWSIPVGEVLSPGLMLGISLSSCASFCLISGSVFALAWSIQAPRHGFSPTTKDENRRGLFRRTGESGVPPVSGSRPPVAVYLGEAAGAAAGGLFFYFILLPHASALAGALIVSVLLSASALAAAVPATRRISRPARLAVTLACLLCFLVTAGTLVRETRGGPDDFSEAAGGKPAQAKSSRFSGTLDALSRKWQWGANLAAIRDTPFHNLALLGTPGQSSLFANGLWLFSLPDPQTSEFAVHPALIQHPHPRTVLILGGGAAGLVAEVLKHPDIESVDYVEPDPQVIDMVRESAVASSPALSALDDPRVRIFHADGASFARDARRRYDVALLDAGEPMNAETNRFYTVEFYRQVARLLNPGGIFSFGTASAPDVIGPTQVRFLRSVHATLCSIFPAVMVYPGETARFFASNRAESLVRDPRELADRIAARNLDSRLQYFREYYLFDYLSPMRMNTMAALLRGGGARALNRDFEPTCYLNNLIVWSAQMHPALEKALIVLSGVGRARYWVCLISGLAALVLAFRLCRFEPRVAVGASVAVVGGVLMALEIVLLLSFQILKGFVYAQLALIIPFFMAGIALGTALIDRWDARIAMPRRWLAAVQGLLCLYTMGVLEFLFALHDCLQTGSHPVLSPALSWAIPVLFPALALGSGILGGLHFPLAVKASERPTSGRRTPGQAAEAPGSLSANAGPRSFPLKPESIKPRHAWTQALIGMMVKNKTQVVGEACGLQTPGPRAPILSGPALYAFDLLGAAAAALIAGIFLLPVFGIPTTMLSLAALTLASLATLAF